MNKIKYIPAVLIAVACLALQQANAQTVTYEFTSDHLSGPGGAGTPPFGTVTLTQNGANVDFDVALTAGYQFVLTGSADFQYFKFNGVGVALGDIVNIDQNFPGFTLSAATGAFNGDGTGDFEFGITSDAPTGGANPYDGPLSFTVNDATIAELTQPNNLGNLFVADILAPNGNTGPVDVIPEPSATLLVPIGGILGFLLRFRSRK